MIPGPMRAFHPAAFAPPLPVLSSPLISPVHSLPRRYHAPSIQLHFSTTKHRARGGRCVALRDVSASGGAEQTAPTGKDADATGGLPAGKGKGKKRAPLLLAGLSIAAFAWLLSGPVQSLSIYLRYALSGGICSLVSHSITVPIDVVKTRLQTDPSMDELGFRSGLRRIYRDEGAKGLMVGAGSTAIGFTIQGAVKYGSYEFLKGLLFPVLPESKMAVWLLAGCFSEMLGTTLLCPLEATRIRLVADPSFGSGVRDAFPKLVRQRGWGIFAGLPAILSKHVPGNMAQLASYELATALGYSLALSLGVLGGSSTAVWISVGAALVAAICSSLASQPGDTVLSEMYKDGDSIKKSWWATVISLRREDWWRGTNTRLLHVVAIVATQLIIYDFVNVLVGLGATGAL